MATPRHPRVALPNGVEIEVKILQSLVFSISGCRLDRNNDGGRASQVTSIAPKSTHWSALRAARECSKARSKYGWL